MGRKLMLTKKKGPQIIQRVREAISVGAPFEVACKHAGITAATGYSWLKVARGEDPAKRPSKPYLEFLDAVETAEAQLQVDLLTAWTAAAIGAGKVPADWRAGESLMKRRWPEHFGDRKVEGEQGDVHVQQILVSIANDLAARSLPQVAIELPAGARGLPAKTHAEVLDDLDTPI